MKLKAKVKDLLSKAKVEEPADCCPSEKCCEARPRRTFKVTVTVLDSEWYSSIQRYVIVNPMKRDEVIISETKLFEFEVYDAWSARDILDSNKFESVKVETVNKQNDEN